MTTIPVAHSAFAYTRLKRGTAERRSPADLRALLFVLLAIVIPSPAVRAQSGNSVQYLFALNGGQHPVVQTYTVDAATGALAPIAAPPAPFRSQTVLATVNRAGTFLFGASNNSPGNSAVTVLAIASDGSVAELAASPFAASGATMPVGIAVSLDGNYLYLATPGSGASGVIDVFSIASDGTLALVNSYAVSIAPQKMFLHPTGSWLYVYGEPLSGQYSAVEQFNVGISGNLTDMGAIPLENYSTSPMGFTGNNAGTFLFAVHGQFGGSKTFISTLAVNPVTGAPSVSSIFDNGSGPLGQQQITVDSTENFIFTSFGSFSITNGALSLLQSIVSSGPYPPPLLVASPNRPYLFSDGITNQAQLLSSDAIGANGSLTPAPGSPYNLNIVAWAIAVSGNAPIPHAPAVTLTPATPQNLGSIVTGHTGSASLSIMNSGFATLIFTSFAISGDPSFAQTNDCAATLPSGASCVVHLTFAPTSTGTFTGSVVISSNAPTATVALSGTGISPYPIPGFSPQNLTFPSTVIGSKSASQSLAVLNDPGATASMVVQNVTFGGSNPNDFSETNNCTAPVAIGGSCSIAVTFSPLALGARTASLLVAINGTQYSTSVSSDGVTTPPQYTLQTSAVGPGTIQQAPSGASFSANTSITLTAVPNSNATFASWSGGACPGSTNAVCTFAITANTSVTATFTANPAVTISQPSQTGSAGSAFTFTINEAGFTTTPTLTASCAIPQGTCSISGTTLTVTTKARSSALVLAPSFREPSKFAPAPISAVALVLAILLLWANPRSKRGLRSATLVGGLAFLAACGGSGSSYSGNSNTGTPAGTYQVMVQATAGAQSATTTVTVTVQ
jgi:hypothetical protein